jgi:hypothetical protein
MPHYFLKNELGGGALELSLVGFLAAFSVFVVVVHFLG